MTDDRIRDGITLLRARCRMLYREWEMADAGQSWLDASAAYRMMESRYLDLMNSANIIGDADSDAVMVEAAWLVVNVIMAYVESAVPEQRGMDDGFAVPVESVLL
jgi:hypothetical protein